MKQYFKSLVTHVWILQLIYFKKYAKTGERNAFPGYAKVSAWLFEVEQLEGCKVDV